MTANVDYLEFLGICISNYTMLIHFVSTYFVKCTNNF